MIIIGKQADIWNIWNKMATELPSSSTTLPWETQRESMCS